MPESAPNLEPTHGQYQGLEFPVREPPEAEPAAAVYDTARDVAPPDLAAADHAAEYTPYDEPMDQANLEQVHADQKTTITSQEAGIAALVQDNADLTAALEQARIDKRTGLMDRGGLDRWLTTAWGVADQDYAFRSPDRRSIPNFSRAMVILGDMGELKVTNDELGRRYGDTLLAQFAQGIDGLMRDDDVVASIGGDDFLMIVPIPDRMTDEDVADYAASILDRLKKNYSQPRARAADGQPIDPAVILAAAKDRQSRGEDPELKPVGSFGAAWGDIRPLTPAELADPPNAAEGATSTYHVLRRQASAEEKHHKLELIAQGVLLQRPGVMLGDHSPNGGT
jgi:diguanylate cyclase (GGDEF)-like protein